MKNKFKVRIFILIYIGFVLYITIFSREPWTIQVIKMPLWEYRSRMWTDIFMNILLFIPIGFLFGSKKGILISFIFSSVIEIMQYSFMLGYSEFDDVINNTLGAFVGFLICRESGSIMLKKWEDLPAFMKNDEVKIYYDILKNKRISLLFKRCFDIIVSIILLLILFVPMLFIALIIKLDSKGPVLYRQERVTRYGKKFRIHKFRTMINNADKVGTAVTVENDCRITRVGRKLRGLRLDELPQLLDVLKGDMSFVGTRPEATKYVEQYTNEMYATLLLPAGVTSEASILYKDEAKLLEKSNNVDKVYLEEVLPQKMEYNLRSIRLFSFFYDIKIIIKTILIIFT